MLKINSLGYLSESTYDLSNDAQNSVLFGTGNGYFGVRGSLEEFGAVWIQGTYIRGVFDEIIEIPLTFVDNEYMKKYYFDEQKLKEFEYEDSCINICDFLHLRFTIGDKVFYPWEGEVKSWERFLDTSDGSLVRIVTWNDGLGNLTKFTFKRFASFACNHDYIVTCKVERLNHQLKIKIASGVDTLVKTNGQKKSLVKEVKQTTDQTFIQFKKMKKYGHQVALKFSTSVDCEVLSKCCKEQDQIYYDELTVDSDSFMVVKKITVCSNVDYKGKYLTKLDELFNNLNTLDFDKIYQEHLIKYNEAFDKIDVKIEGDDDLDCHLRYANYQTLIGFDRYSTVHSLSAKNLTAEKYNQFVWWDCEIYQAPIFYATFGKDSKSLMMYRYNRLKASMENAIKLGDKGARYAFCSSVNGDENVWIYARHPFLQIHINSDIAYSVINYFNHTKDVNFLKKQGLKINVEILRYFVGRLTKVDGVYHLNNVTGTDEHHPYINDNAYTNYTISYDFKKTVEFIKRFNNAKELGVSEEELNVFEDIANNMYLPLLDNGMIPQFKGYFDLSQTLEVVGNGAGTSFQMKQGGLYHKSQIIKQPDVLVMYSYLNIDAPGNYLDNYKYYKKMCEASSSLTYPVHAICAIDHDEEDAFYIDLMNSIKIDIIDLHKGAYQGVHAASMAGGWYALYRGLFGFEAKENHLVFNPHFVSLFDKITLKFIYQNHHYEAMIDNKSKTFSLISDSKHTILHLKKNGKEFIHSNKTILKECDLND